eukprot:TRINITY_DN3725_c0_g5_i2.p1 TRINITY_DN3725_c0_g5~~TRINITY_DN3725_c0_g5_i2.p1  ORF type:complete len:293 (+),score=67.30 TRINITY_DN3725_c0_g5_i2:108-986(+)
MIRRPPRSTLSSSSAASDVYKRQVLILGGTDANESWDEETEQLMVRAVALASATIAFNQQLADAALLKWPEVRDRLWVIAPSVVVPSPAVGFCAREELGLAPEVVLLVLVAGIRQVKDPLFAVEGLEVLQAHQLHPGARLLIVGPSRDDDEYVHKFQSVIAENPFVHYWQPIDQDKLMAVLQQATAVLNTSLSEGASNAILEAMSLRTPVLARDIPGNAALIEHGVTGLLFKTPAGLAECFELLMTSDRECMAASAQRFFLENHSLDREAREYTRLVRSAIAGFPEANGAVS